MATGANINEEINNTNDKATKPEKNVRMAVNIKAPLPVKSAIAIYKEIKNVGLYQIPNPTMNVSPTDKIMESSQKMERTILAINNPR